MNKEIPSAIPLARTQYIPQRENAAKIIFLIAMMISSLYLMNIVSSSSSPLPSPLSFVVFGLLALWVSVLMLAMAILSHDGTHRVLFRNAFINDLASGLLSAFGGGVPFYANRQFHLTHHSYAHQGEADPEHRMHSKSFYYALIIGSFMGLYLQYKVMLDNLQRGLHHSNKDRKYLWRALKDISFITVMALCYFKGLPALGISPLHSIVPAFLLFPVVFAWRAISDHYGLPKVKRKSDLYPSTKEMEVLENSEVINEDIARHSAQQTSGWVVHTSPWLEWLWSHVNYHEVHHKFPYLSHVHLPQAFLATQQSHRYREVNGYSRSLLALRDKNYYSEE